MLAGCAAHVDTFCADPCGVNEGIPYYLPKRLAKVTVIKALPPSEGFNALLDDAPPIADSNQFYAAKPRRDPFKSKTIDIRTTPDGLLSSAFTTSENRNAGIQDNIRLSSVFFNKEGTKDELNRTLHSISDARSAALAGREAGVVVYEGMFDPESPCDVQQMNCNLNKYGMNLEVSGRGAEQYTKMVAASGVVIRPGTQVPIYVRSKTDGKIVAALGGASTDKPLFNIPLANGAMARESHNVEMREGALTGYYNRQPSEIHGFFQGAREGVEDVGSVAAAIIAPFAAALDVSRTASSQGSSGTESEGMGAESLVGGQAKRSLIDAYAKDQLWNMNDDPTDIQLEEEGDDITIPQAQTRPRPQ
ncbi:MAG: hypothetical protein ACR2IE_17255 [Candidatus Sumerlaeaceae bacterium]